MFATSSHRTRRLRSRIGLCLVLAGLAAGLAGPAPTSATTAEDAAKPAEAGLALAWGRNYEGQLGDGSTNLTSTPVAVALPVATKVTTMDGGEWHTAAVTSSGKVLTWGGNGSGQLGTGNFSIGSATPVGARLPEGATAVSVAAGYKHTLAQTDDGRVLAWGENGTWQLGDGSTEDNPFPTAVPLPPATTVTSVAAASSYSLAVTNAGQVLAWGRHGAATVDQCVFAAADLAGDFCQSRTPAYVVLPPGTIATAVAASGHALVLTTDGRVLAWGSNRSGQLGTGDTADSSSATPVPVRLPAGTTIRAVAAGSSHSLALTSAGEVLAWGGNDGGQLGDGTTTDASTPVAVALPPGARVTAIAAGSYHSLAVTDTGKVLAWGWNSSGQLGDGSNAKALAPIEVALPPGARATAVAAGYEYSLAVVAPPALRAVADFDADNTSDVSVFRPSAGTWYLRDGAPDATAYGTEGDAPVPADYDGDRRADVAVFRPSSGTWFIRNSATATEAEISYGTEGDIPVPADYDGDAKADTAVFRPSSGVWYIRNSTTATETATAYGTAGDIPVVGDYDGDQKADLAVFRPSTGTWFVAHSGGGETARAYGTEGDVPVPADFDGDAKADIAVFRPSAGTWYVHNSATATETATAYGTAGDVPVPGHYDGDDTKADIAVFRPSAGTWFMRNSTTGTEIAVAYGTQGDVPLALPHAISRAFFS